MMRASRGTHRTGPHGGALRRVPWGGVQPDDGKGATDGRRTVRLPVPKEVAVPLSQHVGAPARCVVEKKQRVLKGEVIGEAQGFVSCRVHASTSGVVAKIVE